MPNVSADTIAAGPFLVQLKKLITTCHETETRQFQNVYEKILGTILS